MKLLFNSKNSNGKLLNLNKKHSVLSRVAYANVEIDKVLLSNVNLGIFEKRPNLGKGRERWRARTDASVLDVGHEPLRTGSKGGLGVFRVCRCLGRVEGRPCSLRSER